MKYLLDTIAWIWSVEAPERLNDAALEILENGKEEIYLSVVACWEISIKMRLGKLKFPGPPASVVPRFMERQGLRPLAVSMMHAAKIYDLPLHHNDPFDRMMITQAMVEGMAVLTTDSVFGKYSVDVIWCQK